MDYGLIAIKLSTGFLGLWFMTRILGKKEIAQLTPFDFVSSLMLSELVGNTVYQSDIHFSELIFGLGLWALLSYLFEKLTQHVRRLRGPLEGEPSVLIRNGEIDLKQLRKNRLDFEQLRVMLRQKDVFCIAEVAYAIFETNGAISILKRSDYDTVQRQDLDLPEKPAYLSYSLLEDGRIDRDNLRRIGKDEAWLSAKLEAMGYPDPKQVAYAEWNEGEGMYALDYPNKNARGERSGG